MLQRRTLRSGTIFVNRNRNTHITQYLIKLSQSENEVRNIFLEKSYTKSGGETISRPFSKKSKLGVSLDQYPKIVYNLFLLYAKLRAIEIR